MTDIDVKKLKIGILRDRLYLLIQLKESDSNLKPMCININPKSFDIFNKIANKNTDNKKQYTLNDMKGFMVDSIQSNDIDDWKKIYSVYKCVYNEYLMKFNDVMIMVMNKCTVIDRNILAKKTRFLHYV